MYKYMYVSKSLLCLIQSTTPPNQTYQSATLNQLQSPQLAHYNSNSPLSRNSDNLSSSPRVHSICDESSSEANNRSEVRRSLVTLRCRKSSQVVHGSTRSSDSMEESDTFSSANIRPRPMSHPHNSWLDHESSFTCYPAAFSMDKTLRDSVYHVLKDKSSDPKAKGIWFML